MRCVLCNQTSAEAKIDLFPLSPRVRAMLLRQFGIDPDEALRYHGVCRKCLTLPADARNNLAASAIQNEQDEYRRELIVGALNQSKN